VPSPLDPADGSERGGSHRQSPVRAWLDAPVKLRLVGPRYDPAEHAAHNMTGGSLAEWFDAVGFVRQVTPVHRLNQPPTLDLDR